MPSDWAATYIAMASIGVLGSLARWSANTLAFTSAAVKPCKLTMQVTRRDSRSSTRLLSLNQRGSSA
jgi:hypothetical protein